jgi:4'-phosphopantetheinyl transferase
LPPASEVHVSWIHPGSLRTSPLLARFESMLSAEERERHQRFVFPDDRHIYLVAHALLRTTLSRYADVDPAAWAFTAGPYGRPEISGPPEVPPIRFSLSHTKDLAAVAVAMNHDVGMDVERVSRQTDCSGLARQFFAPLEANQLAALPADQRATAFFQYWTLKEAFVKATGLGLSMSLRSFWFELGDPPTVSFAEDCVERASDWHFAQIPLGPEYIGAVAIRAGSTLPSIVVREWVP